MKLSEAIEAVENAVTFLEALGYKSGDVHDDLANVGVYLRKRKAALEHMRAVGEAYSAGLAPTMKPEVA